MKVTRSANLFQKLNNEMLIQYMILLMQYKQEENRKALLFVTNKNDKFSF